MKSNLCSVSELQRLLDNPTICIIDSSWYMPAQAIDTRSEHLKKHIPGAVFFHIDEVCDLSSDLPHMLPSAEEFSTAVATLGISNEKEVIVYDSAGLFSAARVWWMFKVFGHQKVRVLQGGLPTWVAAGGEVSDVPVEVAPATYHAQLDANLVVDKAAVIANCESKECVVLDARSNQRFLGTAPEPRPGLSSGHMPESRSLPFDQLLENGQLKTANELRPIFASLGVNEHTKVITSCGSGVTAAIITLALSEAGFGMQRLYDGAWSEWASANDTVVLT